jgi:hypothetical protein
VLEILEVSRVLGRSFVLWIGLGAEGNMAIWMASNRNMWLVILDGGYFFSALGIAGNSIEFCW